MKIKQKLQILWKEKWKILEAWYNYYLTKKSKTIAEERLVICRSNKCKNYDQKGESPHAFISGKESCGICGCVLSKLVHSLSSDCSLANIGQMPLWTSEIIKEGEDNG